MNELPRPTAARLRRLAAALAVGVVLASVFWAYLDPHTVLDLSNRFWSCFG